MAPETIPVSFELRAAGANPARGDMTFAMSVPRFARIEVRIFDLGGRTVRRLIDGDLAPGEHALTWDGADEGGRRPGAGVYFVRMRAPVKREGQEGSGTIPQVPSAVTNGEAADA